MKLVTLLHAGADDPFCRELEKHLAPLKHGGDVELWHRGRIPPGASEGDALRERVEQAALLVLLVSPDYLAEHHLELTHALGVGHERGTPVVPVVIRPCMWKRTALARLQPLPDGETPVAAHPDRDAAWERVATGIEEVLARLPVSVAPVEESPPPVASPPCTAIVLTDGEKGAPPEERGAQLLPSLNAAYRLLAVCDDEAVAGPALELLICSPALTEDDVSFFRERIDGLPHERMLRLIYHQGHLGCAAKIVDRLVAGLPEEREAQLSYLAGIAADGIGYHILFGTLSPVLGQEAYADFVDRVGPRVEEEVRDALRQAVRGGVLFNALVKADSDAPSDIRQRAPERMRRLLFDVRNDDEKCRQVLEALVESASTRELFWYQWVLVRAGCPSVATLAHQRIIDRFGELGDDNGHGRPSVDVLHWRLVKQWVTPEGPERPARVAWLAERVMDLQQRDFSFFEGYGREYEFPEALRREVAAVLLEQGQTPWWTGDVLLERLSRRNVKDWKLVFQWWQPWQETRWILESRISKQILTSAPMPEDAGDDFDERFLACVRDEMAYEQHRLEQAKEMISQPRALHWAHGAHVKNLTPQEIDEHWRSPTWDRYAGPLRPFLTMHVAFGRLLEMKLTPARATRIARALREAPDLLKHPRMEEVADLAAPLTAEELPEPVDREPREPLKGQGHPRRVDYGRMDDRRQFDLYRKLGGHAADERLRALLREEIEQEECPGLALEWMCQKWPWIEQIAGDALLAELRAAVRDEPVHFLAKMFRSTPWLVDKAMLHAAAERDLDKGWGWEMEHLPPSLLPLVVERARRATHAYECKRLLEWLDKHGISRAARLDLLLAPGKTGWEVEHWAKVMAPMLVCPTDWEEDGPRVVRDIVERRAWFQAYHLWERLRDAWNQAPEVPAEGGPPPEGWNLAALTRVAHEAFAAAIMDQAEAAARSGDRAGLLAMLDAISRLHHGSAVAQRLAELACTPGLPEEARARIDRELSLLAATDGGAPPFDALLHATNVAFTHYNNPPRIGSAP